MRKFILSVFQSIKNLLGKSHVRIVGVNFTDGGKDFALFIGQSVHVPHDGECMPFMQCQSPPITKICTSHDNTIWVVAGEMEFEYKGVEIKNIYRKRG